ncbi:MULTISPECIES: MFS transporter [unclassified Pantoea]|uniref:MFS transporter n=1 Tax=unclassified Pantoea TaxID=2630326 RepID=UPI000534644A|nr:MULTISPECIES: MFS transporter [unclassified Pantoea]MDU6389336.1 MFS transporter [Pantoea sp.]
MSSSTTTLPAAAAARITLYAFVCAMLFSATSSAPTPLYPLYRTLYHLSPLAVTLIFASYAFALLFALLTLGRLSDFIGRRVMMLAALLCNALALLMFMLADSAQTLIAARIVQGIATGIALPTFGAAILDGDKARGPLLNSITAFLGLLAGSLTGALLITFAPFPTVSIYALLFTLMLLALALLPLMPETVARTPGALRALKPQVAIPPRALGALLRLAPVNVAAWALGGFYLSLMPTLAILATDRSSPFVGGAVVATLMLSATASVFIFRRWQPQRALFLGTLALMAGIGVTLIGINHHQTALLFLGTAVAGQGFGSIFSTIISIVMPLAESHERAGLFAAFLIKSYLAFALPALLAGCAVPMIGLVATANVYCWGIFSMAAVSLLAGRRAVRLKPERG